MCSDDEITYTEAKEEFEYWLELFQDSQKDNPKDFRFKYKKGREPDVLAYLILETSEQRKFRN
jgi:hypothetical protein